MIYQGLLQNFTLNFNQQGLVDCHFLLIYQDNRNYLAKEASRQFKNKAKFLLLGLAGAKVAWHPTKLSPCLIISKQSVVFSHV